MQVAISTWQIWRKYPVLSLKTPILMHSNFNSDRRHRIFVNYKADGVMVEKVVAKLLETVKV